MSIKSNSMVYQGMQVTACKRGDNSQDDIDSSDLSPQVISYINKLKTQYEKDYQTLRTTVHEYEHKYNELKEKYDLLLYKRFMRSAEQLLRDEKQPLLFTEEDEGHASSAAMETP